MRIAAFCCARRPQIWIPETEYYQKVSSHAQIRPQGAEKQLRKVVVVVVVGVCPKTRTAPAQKQISDLRSLSITYFAKKLQMHPIILTNGWLYTLSFVDLYLVSGVTKCVCCSFNMNINNGIQGKY